MTEHWRTHWGQAPSRVRILIDMPNGDTYEIETTGLIESADLSYRTDRSELDLWESNRFVTPVESRSYVSIDIGPISGDQHFTIQYKEANP